MMDSKIIFVIFVLIIVVVNFLDLGEKEVVIVEFVILMVDVIKDDKVFV